MATDNLGTSKAFTVHSHPGYPDVYAIKLTDPRGDKSPLKHSKTREFRLAPEDPHKGGDWRIDYHDSITWSSVSSQSFPTQQAAAKALLALFKSDPKKLFSEARERGLGNLMEARWRGGPIEEGAASSLDGTIKLLDAIDRGLDSLTSRQKWSVADDAHMKSKEIVRRLGGTASEIGNSRDGEFKALTSMTRNELVREVRAARTMASDLELDLADVSHAIAALAKANTPGAGAGPGVHRADRQISDAFSAVHKAEKSAGNLRKEMTGLQRDMKAALDDIPARMR